MQISEELLITSLFTLGGSIIYEVLLRINLSVSDSFVKRVFKTLFLELEPIPAPAVDSPHFPQGIIHLVLLSTSGSNRAWD